MVDWLFALHQRLNAATQPLAFEQVAKEVKEVVTQHSDLAPMRDAIASRPAVFDAFLERWAPVAADTAVLVNNIELALHVWRDPSNAADTVISTELTAALWALGVADPYCEATASQTLEAWSRAGPRICELLHDWQSLRGTDDERLRRIGDLALARRAPNTSVVSGFCNALGPLLKFAIAADAEPTRASRLAWLRRCAATKPNDAPNVLDRAGFNRREANHYLAGASAGEHGNIVASHIKSFTSAQRAEYFARVRDVQNVAWSEACLSLADSIRAVAVDGERYGRPVEVVRYCDEPTETFVWGLANAEAAASIAGHREASAIDPLTTVERCAVTGPKAGGPYFTPKSGDTNFYARVPIGDFGEPLAVALAEAASLAMSVAHVVAKPYVASPNADIFMLTSINGLYPEGVLREGIVSMAQALGLLLAKCPAPPYDTPLAVLDLIDRSHLVTQLAGMAPFGLIAPMATTGMVPTDAIGVVRTRDGERARLPAGLARVFDAMHDERVAMLHHGDLSAWLRNADHRSQTGRGCPVAGRGPVLNAKGEIVLSEDAPLTRLANAYIDLVKRVLDAQHRKT